MRVSIIVPTYNSEKTVEKCLLSLTEQTCKPYEIIVADGRSDDSTTAIVKKFGNVKLMINDKSNKPGSSRNLASQSAKGDILLFIDSDCIADQRLLEYHVRCYERNVDIDGVKGTIRSLVKCEISNFVQRQLMASQWLNLNPNGTMRLFHAGTNFSIHKSIFMGEKFREELVSCEDTELFIRLKKKRLKVLYEPRAFVYHPHPTTLRELFRQRKWHGAGIYHLVKLHENDFAELYPLFKPEKYVNAPKDHLFRAVFHDNRLLCEGCQLEHHLGCKIDAPKISKALANSKEGIQQTEIRRVLCLSVAAGILKQRTGIDYQW